MPELSKIALLVANGIGAFALLLLIISVGTTTWLDDGQGNTVGLFRKCYGDNATNIISNATAGCVSENRSTQGGLSVFGLLLLAFSVIVGIPGAILNRSLLLWISLGLMYFSSIFVMSAYASWGVYSRDPVLFLFPFPVSSEVRHTSMGASYNLCAASHYFLWTALTLLAFGIGASFGQPSPSSN